MTSNRRFPSETAARDARRRTIEQVARPEVDHNKQTFGEPWERWLGRVKPCRAGEAAAGCASRA
jgi:hypothetical protein